MGRKKKEGSIKEKISFFDQIREETLQAVVAVIFFVLGVFFILSALGLAGPVGKTLFPFFIKLFGYGYYILPVLFFALCVSYFRSLKQNFATAQTIGSILFFLSALGLINIMVTDGGGMVGGLVANPLISLFDVYATSIILVALVVISFLIVFDTTLNIDSLLGLKTIFKKIFGKKELPNEIPPIILPEVNTNIEEAQLEKPSAFKSMFAKKTETEPTEEEFVSFKRKSISLAPFTPPPLSLLEKDRGKPDVGDVKANANIIKRTLQNFGIIVEMDEVSIGPSVTRYALKPAEGVKLSRILGLQNNLELALAAHPVRIEAPIPGKSLVGIEIPNSTKTTVGLGTLLAEQEFQTSDKPLLVSLGKGISGKSHFGNIAKMPHLLIAGATGSGKSVTIHAMIASLLYRNPPDNLKLIMIDPKRVELTLYNGIPHLLTPVITEAKKTILALKWMAKEMDRRYDILESHSARDIDSYHKNILLPAIEKMKAGTYGKDKELPETMPYMVIVIDELADIMQAYPRELESAIIRLAQMSRAVGIHLILSTQRPSVNVITGLIKANIPTRVALQVASQIDSRTILDQAGAEKLLGAGDMLYQSGEMSKPVRLQSAFITENEVKKLVKYLRDNYESEIPQEIDFSQDKTKNPMFDSGVGDDDDDELYEEARETVISAGKASTSYLQRKLGVGYARAARLIDMLEERGVVGVGSGSKPRDVLIKSEGGVGSDMENTPNDLS
jgi:S-DNA-T family DNA segregation ATPase FtsK/SpoIIIE